MRITTRYFLLIFFLLTKVAVAQTGFVPIDLGEKINTSYDEINPVLSPDGKTLFFTRVNHPENSYGEKDSQDIWSSTLQSDGTWSVPSRILNLNIGRYNSVLSISGDGNTLLLNGIYNKKGNIWKKRGLSTATKIGADEWSGPEKLKVNTLSRRNRGIKSSGSMSYDGQFIVLSFTRGYNSNRSNLFIAKRRTDGHYKRPKKIGRVNSTWSEDAPFLSADGKTLYFASNREGRDRFDIYKATRDSDNIKKWSAPVALNDTINSTGWDSYFKTNITGTVAYFSSARKEENNADIYKVKIVEENPFVIVSGTVKNVETKKLLKDKAFTIMVDGRAYDSVTINKDSASFKIKLPLRKRYNISAAVPNFTSVPDTIDVTNKREFFEFEKDLFATPSPYVLVKGKLYIKNTTQTVPATASPKVVINNVVSDSASINPDVGSYEVKLKRGEVYNLKVTADRFESSAKTLDLSKVEEYEEMIFDLFVDAEKMATVTGSVINKKTGKPLIGDQTVKINVEGLGATSATIDPASGLYQLRLPLGKMYTISAGATNFYPIYETIDISGARSDINVFKNLIIVPIEVGQSIRLNNIFFETAKAVLKRESFPELDRVIDFLTQNSEIKIEIAGHTDNVGKVASNQKLSLARAKSVAAYLASKGIATDRIVSKGYGSNKPVAPNKTAAGKAQNRRVEFTILDK
jgi:outer membrane protein OmpA-like peptidoglycan-associated protein